MKHYFNGFSTLELVEMKHDTDEKNKNIESQKKIDKILKFINKELFNINVQENIMLKNELIKIKSIILGDDVNG